MWKWKWSANEQSVFFSPAPTRTIKFVTHNIEGHERSNNSCQKLISTFKPDFFFRQEDWLFEFQHFKLSQVHSNYVGIGMSVDYDNPVFTSGSEKAKWGLDTLFKKELSCFVTPLTEHSGYKSCARSPYHSYQCVSSCIKFITRWI